jgi:hypothetical protein
MAGKGKQPKRFADADNDGVDKKKGKKIPAFNKGGVVKKGSKK